MSITVSGTTITFNDATTQTTAAGQLRSPVYTSSTTWVAPASVTSVLILCIGGGGGCGTNFARNGAGGGFAYGIITVVPGTTYTVTIGAGGAQGALTGTAGGESWFGVDSGSKLVSATGGGGGPNSASQATFGTGTGGTIRNQSIGYGTVPTENIKHGVANIFGKLLRESLTTSGLVWSIGINELPGAGGRISSACCVYTSQAGGVGGLIALQYVGA